MALPSFLCHVLLPDRKTLFFKIPANPDCLLIRALYTKSNCPVRGAHRLPDVYNGDFTGYYQDGCGGSLLPLVSILFIECVACGLSICIWRNSFHQQLAFVWDVVGSDICWNFTEIVYLSGLYATVVSE